MAKIIQWNMHIILDATSPPSKLTQQLLVRLEAQRIIFIGDRRGSIRPVGDAKIIKMEANPLFPAQVLTALGYTSKTQGRIKEELPQLEAPAETEPAANAPSIVVADDDIGNRELFGAYLENLSKDVRFAEDGQQALDLCAQTRPDFLIADLRMPNVDGFALIERIRAEEKEKNLKPIKILLITADALEETAEKAKASAANVYLTKPIRKSQLLEAIRGLSS